MKIVVEFASYDEMVDYAVSLTSVALPEPDPIGIAVEPAVQAAPVQAAPVQAAPVTIPTAQARTYTPDELSLASRPIVEAGRQAELLDLLHSFSCVDKNGAQRSVQNIMELPPEMYAAFADGVRRLGGRI